MLLKDKLLNGELIEATADAILNFGASPGRENALESIKKEITSLTIKIGNLTRILADGFDSESVREAALDMEKRKKLLEQQLQNTYPVITKPVSRDFLIKELSTDARRVMDEPGCMKEILNKYILNIKIADDKIEINAISDLNTIGCGGQI